MASILVVEDEAEIAELFQRILVREGYRVDLASHGLAALQALQGRSYDLIISNLRMPVMDGPAFYAQLVEQRPDLARRLIFCTGDTISPETRSFLLSNKHPVLPKPFGVAELRQIVRCFLEKRPYEAAIARLMEEPWAAAAV